jgi:IS30 family transposase
MCYAHLTRRERYQIEELRQRNVRVVLIARKLGVHRSTVYRELRRGVQVDSPYEAAHAQAAAERRARRSAANHPRKPASWWRAVARRLQCQWSPEEIRGRALRLQQPHASVPAIYAWIQRQRARGKVFHKHLRYAYRRELRLERFARSGHKARPRIRDRPQEARDRRIPGHWEGDTMRGSSSHNDVVLALVERTSRLVRLRMIRPGQPVSDSVNQHIKQALKGLPVRSLTFDNGSEFMRYEQLQRELCPVFFCDPRSPNQRATCENTIGLVRQYIPKGFDFSKISARAVAFAEQRLNERPRKCLGYRTPFEVLFDSQPDVALRT